MKVKIAEIDMDGWRSTVHEIGGVTSFHHERGCEENGWTDTITLIVGGGQGTVGDEQTMKGRGYGLDVVSVEEE
jgi:hypothetical protein